MGQNIYFTFFTNCTLDKLQCQQFPRFATRSSGRLSMGQTLSMWASTGTPGMEWNNIVLTVNQPINNKTIVHQGISIIRYIYRAFWPIERNHNNNKLSGTYSTYENWKRVCLLLFGNAMAGTTFLRGVIGNWFDVDSLKILFFNTHRVWLTLTPLHQTQ